MVVLVEAAENRVFQKATVKKMMLTTAENMMKKKVVMKV